MVDVHDEKDGYSLIGGAYTFALLGLVTTVEQLVRDALHAVIENNAQAHKKFVSYIVSHMRGSGTRQDAERVARAIAFAEPGIMLRKQLQSQLIERNHRRKANLLEAASYFGIPPAEICSDLEKLQKVLQFRELLAEHDRTKEDPNLPQTVLPSTEVLKQYIEYVYVVTVAFYTAVEKRLEGMQRRAWN